jgi:hypothetical protein
MQFLLRRKSLKIEVDGISLDALYKQDPIIYDPIPESERANFTYFRGINLGKLACNVLQGKAVLNTGKDGYISFSSYYRAHWAARSITGDGSGDLFQFTHDDRSFIEEQTGLALPTRMPAMIIALAPNVSLGTAVDIERYDHTTPLSELESISKLAVQQLFTLPDRYTLAGA